MNELKSISIQEWLNSSTVSFFRFFKPRYWIKKFRYQKANKKWKKDFDSIKKLADMTDRHFYWYQLVSQEITMTIDIGKKMPLNEFVWLCARRGFNLEEQNYLQSMLEHLRLFKIK